MEDKKNKNRQPINLRKKPRLLTIQPSEKPITILISLDPTKTRIWLEGLPNGSTLGKLDETVDTNS